MAAGGFKNFVAGEILTAADVNAFLMQGVLVFDDAADRSAQLSAPVAGQVSYRKDDDLLEAYDGADWVPVRPRPLASGGTESDITVSGEAYRLHTFTSNGTFTVTRGGPVDFVVVAGGGAGAARSDGNRCQGGGGAGGVLVSSVDLTPGSYSIVIGAGGASSGSKGSNSSGFGFDVSGGGAGRTGADGSNDAEYILMHGGSGGGGGNSDRPLAGFGARPIGFFGGNGQAGANDGFGGGGGGGAAQAGAVGTTSVGGKGGDGLDLSAFLGQSAGTTYKGGGGGGSRRGGSPGAGGLGGGTAGATTGSSSSSPANSGGASGGSSTSAGSGGSGIVYVRYRK
jgi:hypothetical protein